MDPLFLCVAGGVWGGKISAWPVCIILWSFLSALKVKRKFCWEHSFRLIFRNAAAPLTTGGGKDWPKSPFIST